MPAPELVKIHHSKLKSLTEDSLEKKAASNQKLQFHFILKPGTPLPANKSLAETGKIYSLEEFDKKYRATTQAINAVKKFALQQALEVLDVQATNWMVTLEGDVKSINEALKINLGYYNLLGDTPVLGHHQPFTIPKVLKEHVTGILGLSKLKLDRNIKDKRELLTNHTSTKGGLKKKDLSDCLKNCDPEFLQALKMYTSMMQMFKGISPQKFADIYNFPNTYSGKGVTVGLIEMGGGYCDSDVQQFMSNNKLNSPPDLHDIFLLGARNNPCGNKKHPAMNRLLAFMEVSMDLQVVLGLAPDARIVNYFTEASPDGLFHAFMEAASDTVHHPDIISLSWGGLEEYGYSKNQMTCINQALKKVAMLGITTYATSGDKGSFNGVKGELVVNFPASNHHVIGCGGTTATLSENNKLKEVVWNGNLMGKAFASGGGFSKVAQRAYHQSRVIAESYANKFNLGVPDVAANADFTTMGYEIVVSGTSSCGGGTSAVAPLWAGFTARLCEAVGGRIPYFNHFLYSIAGTKAFNQILKTNNIVEGSEVKNYQAGKIWNPCTGLGTPNGKELLKALLQYLNNR